MKHALISAALLTLLGSNPSFAYYCADGQQPVPPEIAARMALPLCGFAATKRWGPNGCQMCDARNMHPNPFAADSAPVRRARHAHTRKY
jgi:hypothetical protein